MLSRTEIKCGDLVRSRDSKTVMIVVRVGPHHADVVIYPREEGDKAFAVALQGLEKIRYAKSGQLLN